MSNVPKDEVMWIERLSSNSVVPTLGSSGAAGYDLSSASVDDVVVPARGRALVPTGLAIRVPSGTYGRIAPRSGIAVRHAITTGAGVVDEDYRGNVRVLLFNLSDEDFTVRLGDRIAQLVIERIATPAVIVVDALDATERGDGGFGSTGVAAHAVHAASDAGPPWRDRVLCIE